jgi:16S rRNA (guanine527-N7)-methyltransferase
MFGVEFIQAQFPAVSVQQEHLFSKLEPCYAEWNAKVNLVSRKDLDNLYERHVLHSLGIAKFASFSPGMRVVDVGTGGGFPLVPLAILFPQVQFHGIDSIGKKIAAVRGLVGALGLTNCTAEQIRSEAHRKRYDAMVSRAVCALPQFVSMTDHLLPAGSGKLYYLKGGDVEQEVRPFGARCRVHSLADHFPGDFFLTKKVVELDY